MLNEPEPGILPDLAYRLPPASSLSSNLGKRAPCYCSLLKLAPAQVVSTGDVFAGFANRHFRNCFDDPFEIGLTDPGCFAIGRGIAKIDRDRYAVSHRELDSIQIVAEKLIQSQNTFLDSVQNLFWCLPLGLVTQMKRMPRLIRHNPNVALID